MAIERSVSFIIGANLENFHKGFKSAQKTLKRAERKMNRLGSSMTRNISAPLATIGGLSLKAAADFEKLEQSLSILNNSAEVGAEVFENLKNLSAGTPFQLQQLARAQTTLQGFSMEADVATDSIKMIGDIAAVTGGDIQGISVAFGQAKAEGKAMTRDLRQFINQGVPIVDMLAKSLGVATNEIFDMASAGEISFSDLQNAFRQATSEGGRFANGMEKQSETLWGIWSTLKDNLNIALGELGNEIVGTFDIKKLTKDLISNIKTITARFKNMSDESRQRLLKLAGVLMVGGPLLIAISKLIGALSGLVGFFKGLVGVIKVLYTTAIPRLITGLKSLYSFIVANPWALVVAGIAAIGTKAFLARKELDDLKVSLEGISNIDMSNLNLNTATKGLEKANQKIQEIEKNRAEIQKKLESGQHAFQSTFELQNQLEELDKKLKTAIELRDHYAAKQSEYARRQREVTNEVNKAQTSLNQLGQFLDNLAEKNEDVTVSIETLNNALIEQNRLASKGMQNIDVVGLQKPKPVDLTPHTLSDKTATSKFDTIQDAVNGAQETTRNFSEDLANNLVPMISNALGQAAGSFLEMGIAAAVSGKSLKGVFTSVLTSLADLAIKVGKIAITTGLAIEGIKKALQSLNPVAAIAAGAALIALGTIVKSRLKNLGDNMGNGGAAAQMADGGIVPSGFPNDTYPAFLSSGETVLPSPKKLPKGMGGIQTVRVVGELRGDGTDIVATINETKRDTLR